MTKADKSKVKKIQPKKKLRIMLNSNAIWAPSGYGMQAAQFIPKMVEEGYQVACVDFYGLEGNPLYMDGVIHYPKMKHPYGEDAMIHHAKHFKPDVLFTLQDIWVLGMPALHELSKHARWIPIVPIDHEPVPQPIFDRLKLAYRVVTYAPFGERELKSHGMHSTYIPHTVPTDMFKRKSDEERAKMKAEIGIPEDHFVFGMVAANKDMPPRKSFQEVMEAFKRFHDKHPKSSLYLHSYVKTDHGFPIDIFAKKLGIEENIFFPDPYDMQTAITQDKMAGIYSVFDVLLIPSLNEGFGVPIIEAQACNVPVITNDFTAMRDLVEDGFNGYKTRVAYKRFDNLQSYIGIPDVDHLYELMEKMYEHHEKGEIEEMGRNGRKFVEENFDIDLVWEKHWKPFLAKLENEIHNN